MFDSCDNFNYFIRPFGTREAALSLLVQFAIETVQFFRFKIIFTLFCKEIRKQCKTLESENIGLLVRHLWRNIIQNLLLESLELCCINAP